MEPRLLKIFILAFLIYCVSAKRYSGGGGSRTFGSSSRTRPSTSSSSRYTPHSSSSSYHPPSHSYAPSAPTHNTHTSSFGRPSGVVHQTHQQSSAPVSHNNPYERQPAYNPHVTSGHSAPPPYPVNHPNHPHPSNIGSSSFPSNGAYHPPSNGAYHPPSSGAYHPPSNGAYHPPSSGAYHPPSSGGYHPPSSGGYHPPSAGVYQPRMNSAYQPAVGGGYHPPMSGGYHPPSYSQPHTVYVVPDSRGKSSSGPGLGTYIASGVAGGVAAGATNAIVDHAISSIFRPNSHGVHTYPSAPVPGSPTTSITNNYYYNNGAPDANGQPAQTNSYNGQPAQGNNNYNGQPGQSNGNYNGQPAQAGPAPYVPSTNSNQGAPISGGTVGRPSNGMVNRAPDQLVKPDETNFITDDELMKLSEELFDNLKTNINQYVELNLQKRVAANTNDEPLQDESPEPLFIIKTGLDSLPTVSKLRALYDSYQRNGTQKEIVSSDRISKENAFLEELMRTPIMKKTLNWLADKHYVKSTVNEQEELLKNIWFTVFKDTSSGFERAFLSENFGENGIAGMQNWIYFAHLEGKNMVDYLSYVDMMSLSGRGALLRVNFQSEGIPMQNVPIFVGTPPELELALYTVCMHARFNGNCPVSLGGAKFYIVTQGFQENNKYMIESGFPLF